MAYQVFVSSTSKDLEGEREAVLAAILKLDGFAPIAMEKFGAAPPRRRPPRPQDDIARAPYPRAIDEPGKRP